MYGGVQENVRSGVGSSLPDNERTKKRWEVRHREIEIRLYLSYSLLIITHGTALLLNSCSDMFDVKTIRLWGN